jgi:hypothetical protein
MALAAMVAASAAFAHEPTGNLHFVAPTTDLVVVSERLVVGPPVPGSGAGTVPIRAEYEIENRSGAAVAARLVFPSPGCQLGAFVAALAGAAGGPSACARHPASTLLIGGPEPLGEWGLFLALDGAPVADPGLAGDVRAVIDGMGDPAALCRRLGGTYQGGDCLAFGRITIRRVFAADHAFAPGTTRVVHESSAAVAAGGDVRATFTQDAACLFDDRRLLTAWNAYIGSLREGRTRAESYAEIVFDAPPLHGPPIGSIEVVVRTSGPDQTFATCFNGLKKTAPAEWTARRKRFEPRDDLRFVWFPVVQTKP